MASVYRRTKRHPLPDGAAIKLNTIRKPANARVRNGVLMWKDKRGLTLEGLPSPDDDGVVTAKAEWTQEGAKRSAPISADGESILRLSGKYLASWYDHNGKRQTASTRTTDKETADRIARKYEADAALRRDGVIDVRQECIAKESARPITEHVEDFLANLESKQRSPKHVQMTRQHIEWIVNEASIESVGDLSAASMMNAIGNLRQGGASLGTCNAYLRAIKQFSRWLWKEKRSADDPLTGLARFNEQEDQRHVRREMTAHEVAYLLEFTEGHTTANHNLTGRDRAMLYRLAFGTGFRANELRSLTPRSFDLDGDPPTVTVEAAYSKRRRKDVQPIREDLAALVEPWLADKATDQRVFARMPGDTARMMRKDLASARAAWLEEVKGDQAKLERRQESSFLMYQDHDGRFADFHAARHTYISQIVAGGSSVKVAQELARHSTSRLTIDRYAHANLHDVTAALDALPETRVHKPSVEVLSATGTDDPHGGAQRQAQRAPRETGRKGAKACDERADPVAHKKSPKTLPMADLGEKQRVKRKRRRPDSNRGWRICNQTSYPPKHR